MSWVQTIRLLGQRSNIVQGTVTANWNSGIAPSGLAGATLFTFGVLDRWYRLCDAYLVITGFNAAATIYTRYYGYVAGAMSYMFTDNYIIAGIAEDVIYLSWFLDTQVKDPIRIEVYSNQAADDALAVTYEYRWKDW